MCTGNNVTQYAGGLMKQGNYILLYINYYKI